MIEINLKQNTPEWLEFRRKHIGASDAPAIMGVCKFNKPIDIWEEKLGLALPKEINYFMQRGKDLEFQALQMFENLTGILMIPKVVKNSNIDWMIASIDGMDFDNTKAVEIKCPGKKNHECALDGEIPKEYFPQLQHQLAVTGLDKMYYFSYTIESNKIIEVYRDQTYIDNLLKVEEDFWDCVINNEVPKGKK